MVRHRRPQSWLVFLEDYTWHPGYGEVIRPFKKFLEMATADGRITDWMVAWHQPTKIAASVTLDGLGSVPVVTRRRRPEPRIDFIGSDRKHSRALEPIATGLSVVGVQGKDGRGVVLVYLADDRPENKSREKVGALTAEHVVPLLSFAAPLSATPHKRDLIQWTVHVQSNEDIAVDRSNAGDAMG